MRLLAQLRVLSLVPQRGVWCEVIIEPVHHRSSGALDRSQLFRQAFFGHSIGPTAQGGRHAAAAAAGSGLSSVMRSISKRVWS